MPYAQCMERSYARQELTSGLLAGAAVLGVAAAATAAASQPAYPPQTIIVHH